MNLETTKIENDVKKAKLNTDLFCFNEDIFIPKIITATVIIDFKIFIDRHEYYAISEITETNQPLRLNREAYQWQSDITCGSTLHGYYHLSVSSQSHIENLIPGWTRSY